MADHNNKHDLHLPEIETDLSSEVIKERLLTLSKKGKLPGFDSNSSDGVASVIAHGVPFDSTMLIMHESGKVHFRIKLLKLIPTIFAITLIVTIWPGLPLTEGFLRSFQWYDNLLGKIGIETWHWYLPLTILPAPFVMKSSIAKSRTSGHESALEAIEKLKSVL
ncbi:MAG: hypothetical protein P1U42_04080 [Phycisphaerales bacterium]|nr:hypothetical protein [Phycisphaerales bacterium]